MHRLDLHSNAGAFRWTGAIGRSAGVLSRWGAAFRESLAGPYVMSETLVPVSARRPPTDRPARRMRTAR